MHNVLPRSAGILMHISSLPSAFGIGDMGPEAFSFADFLFRSQQSFWQILPLNPTGESEGFSPYSSSSSMAGNIYFISPEELAKKGWLGEEDISAAKLPFKDHADLSAAVKNKESLLWKAYKRYAGNDAPEQQAEFNAFYEENSYWLKDFSYYILLKKLHQQKGWWDWPEEFRFRHIASLDQLEASYERDLHEIRWQQMVFDQQWKALRGYCASLNIRIIGDMPFYLGGDSADVWANREIFAIDKHGKLTGVAGVPPDAFNDDGQLWGMPVYNWHTLKKQRYTWWITRLKKNVELFDLARIDHFRALASYWMVPATEKSAKKGEWKKGPGKAFFKEVAAALQGLPFVAEDLGEISPDVFALRDAFHLPGMNVLQFAFGVDMPANAYMPHHNIANSLMYTGTHDNNTTKGWFKSLPAPERLNLNHYFDAQVEERSICRLLCRLAYSSVSAIAILPIQDVLELDETARMNTPAGEGQNWSWRLSKSQINGDIETKLTEWCSLFDRRRDGDTSYVTTAAALSQTRNAASHG